MSFANFIRGIVRNHPDLKLKLKKANSKQTPFQYVFQSFSMFVMSNIALLIIIILIFKNDIYMLLMSLGFLLLITPIIYRFWFSYVDVQIKKYARQVDSDLMFVAEYFLVSVESGLPLGNIIKRISHLKRPGGEFFKRIYLDFQTGKNMEKALEEGANYSPSDNMKILLKRLKDSLEIGIDLKQVLINFINEMSEKKILEIRAFSKKLNPIIMMYLLVGIVLPSLGLTFFILGAALMQITPAFLKLILIFIFLIMFAFQYLSYSSFKFSRSTL